MPVDPSLAATGPGLYRGLMIGSLLAGLILWLRAVRSERGLWAIYLGGVLGGLSGAKLGYVLAEGWLHAGRPDFWMQLATGKTIAGALLGGYAGIEIAKHAIGWKKATGDWFALVVPVGVALGRVGCLVHGCCLGVAGDGESWWTRADAAGIPRWPASTVELVFNLLAAAVLFALHRLERLPGQLFHVYLVAYGAFRFFHEFLRDTPKVFLGLSGYQWIAAAMVIFGVVRFRRRQRRPAETLWRKTEN
ncbi:MAG: prolipoprotein diacylglyceryl transferase [Akkermansiaceae bacterium]|nr:prolipoprotein diacylglyceryl transferase [Akkermansiaceae bacterium]